VQDRGEFLKVVGLVNRPGLIDRGQDPQQFFFEK
jgi:hypothetical protein